jgi:hypothetical protein
MLQSINSLIWTGGIMLLGKFTLSTLACALMLSAGVAQAADQTQDKTQDKTRDKIQDKKQPEIKSTAAS